MTVPQLNRKLVLEDDFRVPDNSGGFTTQWRPLGTLWAEITAGSGRAQADQALPMSRVALRIVVRAATIGSASRPRAGQRFREDMRIYTINAVTERDRAGRYLVCHAEEGVAV